MRHSSSDAGINSPSLSSETVLNSDPALAYTVLTLLKEIPQSVDITTFKESLLNE